MSLRRRIRSCVRQFVPLWVCLLPCLFVELFSFWIASFLWPIPHILNSDSVVILVVADPQLIGHRNEPKSIGFLSRWDADRYLHRGYMQARRAVHPDLEVFLGDLFDEGVYLDEAQFVNERDRFLQIFPLNDRTNRIYLPGDNDIGGEMEPVYSHLYEMFKRNFPPYFRQEPSPFKQFFSIYETNPLEFGEFVRICGPPDPSGNSVRLLLSHFPVLPHATAKIEQQLRRINVVLSAHDHSTALYMQWRQPPRFGHIAAASDISDVRWTVSMLEPPALPLVEFKSPTVSYRMGVPKMGYGLVVVTPFHSNGTASVQFSVLWLPSRFLQIGLFVCLVSLGVLSTLLSASGCCHRCKIVVRQMLAKQRRRRQ